MNVFPMAGFYDCYGKKEIILTRCSLAKSSTSYYMCEGNILKNFVEILRETGEIF